MWSSSNTASTKLRESLIGRAHALPAWAVPGLYKDSALNPPLRQKYPQTLGMLRTLGIWRSSVWRAVWKELGVWLVLHYAVDCTYHFLMSAAQQRAFEKWCRVCAFYMTTLNFVSLSLFLGFYVSYVSNRWWTMYKTIPWIDKVAFAAVTCIRGGGAESAQAVRHDLVRCCNACLGMAGMAVSAQMRACLGGADGPAAGLETLVDLGLLTRAEAHELERLKAGPATELPRQSVWFLPLMWAAAELGRARDAGVIASDYALCELQSAVFFLDTSISEHAGANAEGLAPIRRHRKVRLVEIFPIATPQTRPIAPGPLPGHALKKKSALAQRVVFGFRDQAERGSLVSTLLFFLTDILGATAHGRTSEEARRGVPPNPEATE